MMPITRSGIISPTAADEIQKQTCDQVGPMLICVATLLLASAFVVLVCRCMIAAGNKIRLAAFISVINFNGLNYEEYNVSLRGSPRPRSYDRLQE